MNYEIQFVICRCLCFEQKFNAYWFKFCRNFEIVASMFDFSTSKLDKSILNKFIEISWCLIFDIIICVLTFRLIIDLKCDKWVDTIAKKFIKKKCFVHIIFNIILNLKLCTKRFYKFKNSLRYLLRNWSTICRKLYRIFIFNNKIIFLFRVLSKFFILKFKVFVVKIFIRRIIVDIIKYMKKINFARCTFFFSKKLLV